VKKILLAVLAIALLFALSIPVSAHDCWLIPKKFRIAPGVSLIISANTGMDFPNSLSPVTPDRIEQFKIAGESSAKDIEEFAVHGNSLMTVCSFDEPGTFVIAAALKPKEIKLSGEEFNAYLLADGLPDIYELRKKEGILDKDAVEFYSKYPKTIIQVGDKTDNSPTVPVGLPIEIVPKINPYTLKRGDNLEVTVLFRGNPLPNADIAWSYPGQGEKFAGSKKTDENGGTLIPLMQPGPYVIRLTHMERVQKPTHEWESYWTSLTFSVNPVAPVDPVVERIIVIGKKDNRTMKHLDVLTNRFGGRPIGSAAYDNAAEWVGRKFKEWGMQVEYDEAGTLAVGFNRGPWFGKMTSPKPMHLHFATPSYSAGTRGKQVGHAVLEPQNGRQFERMKKKLKGAWVLLDPPELSEEELEKRKKMTPEERRELREKERKEHKAKLKKWGEAGILGVIASAPVPINASYNRDVKEWTSWDDLPMICDIKLDEHQFAEIKQSIIERQRVELEFDIRNYFKMGPVRYHNVIGIIPGTEFPDEYVIMGGHLDSFDVATGAVDDGSGVTPAMEAARLIMTAGGKPKRTILVCLWAGEEFGILGAGHWVEEYKDRLPRISNMFNRDGGPTVPTGIYVSEAMWEDMEKICEPLHGINPEVPFELLKRKPKEKPKRPGGTDSSVFAMRGVPTMNFRTADPKGYDFSYSEIWHTENDYYQKSIPEYQEHTSIVTAVVVYGVANLDHLLSREGFYLPDSEPDPKKKN